MPPTAARQRSLGSRRTSSPDSTGFARRVPGAGFLRYSGRVGDRVPDCSDQGGYSLIRPGSPTGNHGQDSPPRGVFHTGWYSGTSRNTDEVDETISVASLFAFRKRSAPRTGVVSGFAQYPLGGGAKLCSVRPESCSILRFTIF